MRSQDETLRVLYVWEEQQQSHETGNGEQAQRHQRGDASPSQVRFVRRPRGHSRFAAMPGRQGALRPGPVARARLHRGLTAPTERRQRDVMPREMPVARAPAR